MANYILQPNEAIILKSKSVKHGFWGGYTDEIMLTNLNFVWTSIGTFGFPKKIYQYPLNQIKVFNGRTQAILGEQSRTKSPMLEMYFVNGQEESFEFPVSAKEAKKEIWKWIKAINIAVTGNELDDGEGEDEISDDSLLGAFREIGTELKEAFIGPSKVKRDSKATSAKPAHPEKIARKCSSCGAPISGTKGQRVRCKYCDSDQQL
ncbi:MAG: hypothetical protein LBQ42_04905 [Synergistaceae bacterium]|jgi:hypothetical protein|nr:hypothetical protein [Synergistaceae bacterium]